MLECKKRMTEKTYKHNFIKQKIADFFRKSAESLKAALFPENITCDLCGAELTAETRYPLCAACMEKLPVVGEHICKQCGVEIDDEADYCLRCQRVESRFDKNRSPLLYEGAAKGLIYAFKFAGKKYISNTLGAMMADCYLSRGMNADVIAFVPMSRKELRNRGFNQSELLAKNVAQRLNIPLYEALLKTKDTYQQKALTFKERAENLKGVFSVNGDAEIKAAIKDKNVLLVDDVFTTGATADECAKVLLKAKVKSVSVLSAAVTKRKNEAV